MATALRIIDRRALTLDGAAEAGNSLHKLKATINAHPVVDKTLEVDVGRESTNGGVDLAELVARIQRDDATGMEELYGLFRRGIRFYFWRHLGEQEMDDKVHDTLLIVVQAIRRGDLREPERLMGFVRTVVRRQLAAHIDRAIHVRRDQVHMDVVDRVADMRRNPEQNQGHQQKVHLMEEILRQLANRDREILTRFYVHEEAPEQICVEMGLTETQFRLLKSRAKLRFGELGKRRLQKPLVTYSARYPVVSPEVEQVSAQVATKSVA